MSGVLGQLIEEQADGVVDLLGVRLAQKLARKAPLALGMAKAVLRACVDTDMTSGHTLEMIAQNVLMDSKDHNEGVRAFRERRKPTFTGM